MRRVRWSVEAVEHLDQAVAYIARDSRRNAESVLDRIADTAAKLGDFATGRRSYAAGLYEKPVRGLPYVIVYQIDNTPLGEEVRILRVVHGARNWRPSEPRT